MTELKFPALHFFSVILNTRFQGFDLPVAEPEVIRFLVASVVVKQTNTNSLNVSIIWMQKIPGGFARQPFLVAEIVV
jgi:hypothetical protein